MGRHVTALGSPDPQRDSAFTPEFSHEENGSLSSPIKTRMLLKPRVCSSENGNVGAAFGFVGPERRQPSLPGTRGLLGVGVTHGLRTDWSLGTPVPSPPCPSLMSVGAGRGQAVPTREPHCTCSAGGAVCVGLGHILPAFPQPASFLPSHHFVDSRPYSGVTYSKIGQFEACHLGSADGDCNHGNHTTAVTPRGPLGPSPRRGPPRPRASHDPSFLTVVMPLPACRQTGASQPRHCHVWAGPFFAGGARPVSGRCFSSTIGLDRLVVHRAASARPTWTMKNVSQHRHRSPGGPQLYPIEPLMQMESSSFCYFGFFFIHLCRSTSTASFSLVPAVASLRGCTHCFTPSACRGHRRFLSLAASVAIAASHCRRSS